MKRHRAIAGPGGTLDVLRDLMLGGRHSRHTVTRFGVSLPTADRWLMELARKVPGVRKVREGTTSWFEWRRPPPLPDTAETAATKARTARAIADLLYSPPKQKPPSLVARCVSLPPHGLACGGCELMAGHKGRHRSDGYWWAVKR